MVNVLLIPTSGLMEFNASAVAGGASATLDNAFANAVRMEIANSATLRFTGKNATNNERIVVSGINGTVLTIRDISAAGGTSGSLETPVAKVTYVSAGTVSATTYLNLPLMGEGQFVDVSGDTMTGRLDLSAAASSTTVLSANGAVFVSGNVTVSSNISAVGEMSSTGAHRGSSGIFTTTVQAPTISGTTGTFGTQVTAPTVSGTTGTFATQVTSPTVSGTTGTFATQVTAPTVSGTTGTFATQVVSPTVSGGTLTVTGNASVTGTVSSTGNMLTAGDVSSTGAHRGSSGIFTTTVQAPTLSGTSATVSSISALSSVSAPSAFVQNISATNISAVTNVSSAAFSGVSARFTDLSATSALAPTISAANISATTNVSSAAFSGVSARFTDLSATSSLAQNVSAASGRFPALSGTVIGTSAIVPGAAAGVAPTDLVISAGTGQVSVSGNTGLALSSGGAISLNATAVNVTNGTLSVTGHFAATSKAFVIDHPTPAKKAAGLKLQYACLEGPENGVYVRGKADTQVGVIELPDYWMDLVHADSITVQLTAMSPAQRLYVAKIEDNKVYVRDASAVSEVTTFFYTVNGERKDIDHLTIEY